MHRPQESESVSDIRDHGRFFGKSKPVKNRSSSPGRVTPRGACSQRHKASGFDKLLIYRGGLAGIEALARSLIFGYGAAVISSPALFSAAVSSS
jgi:hypothetical protein